MFEFEFKIRNCSVNHTSYDSNIMEMQENEEVGHGEDEAIENYSSPNICFKYHIYFLKFVQYFNRANTGRVFFV